MWYKKPVIASISKPETLHCVLHLGDCLEVMRGMADNSVDAVVTDPPYGLSFMGKHWDHGVPGEAFWREVLRVAKPGAHLLAFGGTRTYHRLACAIEDAGWEIRDCVMWVYGSGFPKSHDVSKAIDKAAGAEREVVGLKGNKGRAAGHIACKGLNIDPAGDPITAPATPEATQWSGWGTALKPAWEPIIVARKPLVGTVAENVLAHGTGGINVDGCRVGTSADDIEQQKVKQHKASMGGNSAKTVYGMNRDYEPSSLGRWPANVIHDGSEEVVGLFPETGPARRNTVSDGRAVPFMQAGDSATGGTSGRRDPSNSHDDNGGSAARFFYCAKASKRDRDEGCKGLEEKVASIGNVDGGSGRDGSNPNNNWKDSCKRRVQQGLPPTMPRRNHHPTVKPTDLMRYLCRLVTPPGGVVLDPFMGSGSTGKAAILEGFQFVGIEQEPEYLEIARARIAYVQPESGKSCTTQAYAPAKPKRPDTGQLSLF